MSARASKKLINSLGSCVSDCLEGFVAVNPGLQLLDGHQVVVRRDIATLGASGKVAVIAGGGSGHEPAMTGYVGPGMLSASVAGAVFTSPPPVSILAAIRAVGRHNTAGTLLIVANYTGDRLNFGMAAERARAEGLKVEMVMVGEDCALTSTDKTAGRRGLAGIILMHKIAGALAQKGCSLEEIVHVCTEAANHMGTIGLCLSPCSVPGCGPTFQVGDDEMELGLGVHGEGGVRRMKVLSAKDTVAAMFDHMTKEDSVTALKLKNGDQVALLVNNLGGTSVLEQNIVAKESIGWLESRGVQVERAYSGTFMTSLEMAGLSLTVLHLDDTLKQCLDAPTTAPAWVKPLLPAGTDVRLTPAGTMQCASTERQKEGGFRGVQIDSGAAAVMYKAMVCVCEALGNCEDQLNMMDRQSGDGDCGSTMKRGSQAILKALGSCDNPGLPVTHPFDLLMDLSSLVEESMGGTSGALYSLFLAAAAQAVLVDAGVASWCGALEAGTQAVMRYGGAEPGDRTMLDSLYAAHEALKDQLAAHVSPLEALQEAAVAAQQKAVETTKMAARAGRASYVSREHLTQPDPGAHAVGVWMQAAYEGCKMAMD